MGVEPHQLHVAFFPLMAPGHTLPILDTINLFASHNVRTTIITTPLNAPNLTNSLNGTNTCIEVFPFPAKEVGLPEGIENTEQLTSLDMATKFMNAVALFQDPLERFLEKTRPNCLVADMFFPFASDVAAKFGIPRLVFHGTSFFALCASITLLEHKPYKSVSSDDECFALPNLPHQVKLTRLQLSPQMREEQGNEMIEAAFESDLRSYGVLVNSFYELESDYADYYRKVLGRRAWNLGPVSLSNKGKSNRGKKSAIDEHECLKWLDSKEPNSVIYICFGSLSRFSPSQLHEIAMALESTSQHFIWVVRKEIKEGEIEDKWLPDGFEKRIEGKGMIIRGWAPQVLILEHEAIGGFMTHCGWNSTLEGISSGVPMVTWPLFAEQFINEKLVTEILKIGVPVGSKEYIIFLGEGSVVKWGEIEKALRMVMVGEEALAMRSRVKKLKEMASKAVEEGGSSCSDLSELIEELSSCAPLSSCLNV